MEVNSEKYAALVTRLNRESRERPGWYKAKVTGLALVGYGYIWIVTGILVGIAVWLGFELASGQLRTWGGAVKILIIIGLLVIPALRALWVKWGEPTGIELRREQAPRLFEIVEEVREKLQAPRIHRLIINNEFNAGMEQRPRYGIFGGHEGILHLGLPLMQSQRVDQFRSDLSHELAHLSGNHGRFSGWIYRIRKTWQQLLGALEQQERRGVWLYKGFFQWYAPYFHAYTQALRRAQEFEADRTSVKVGGFEPFVSSHVGTAVGMRYLSEEFWPEVYARAKEMPATEVFPYEEMRGSWVEKIERARAEVWLAEALGERTDADSTHPCLSERLEAGGAVGMEASALLDHWMHDGGRGESTAAQVYLGELEERLAKQLSMEWQVNVAEEWKELYEKERAEQEEFVRLEAKRDGPEGLDAGEWITYANLVFTRLGEEAGEGVLLEILKAFPEHAWANYNLGKRLTIRGEEAGVVHMERALVRDPDAEELVGIAMREYLEAKGDAAGAKEWGRRVEARQERDVAVTREREEISLDSEFMPHECAEEAVKELRGHLQRLAGVTEAYFVRRRLKWSPEEETYLLAFETKRLWYGRQDYAKIKATMDWLSAEATYPGPTRILSLARKWKPMLPKLKEIPGAMIFKRE